MEKLTVEQAELDAVLESQLRASKPVNDDVVTEMLATRREKGFELTPRLIFILQLVALRGYITEGSIEDHIEMCEATLRDICAMSVPVLDAETQIQLRKQHVLWPLRFRGHSMRVQPVYPEIAERIEQVLLCDAPPTSCCCDSGFLRKMMRKAAGEILSDLGYSIRRRSIDADIHESLVLLKQSTGAAIYMPSGPLRLSHMQIGQVLEKYSLVNMAEGIQQCLDNKVVSSQSQDIEELVSIKVDEDAGWQSPELEPTQRLLYSQSEDVVQETPQQELEFTTSRPAAAVPAQADKNLQVQQANTGTENNVPCERVPGSRSEGTSPVGVSPQAEAVRQLHIPDPGSAPPGRISPFGVAAAAGAAAAAAAAGRSAQGNDPYAFPRSPPAPASPTQAQARASGQSLNAVGADSEGGGAVKRRRNVATEGNGSDGAAATRGNSGTAGDAPLPKTMKLKDFVARLKTADPSRIPFVPELVPEKWRAANMMALAALRAAQRSNGKEKNAGGSSEEEDALVAAPVIRQRQTATQG